MGFKTRQEIFANELVPGVLTIDKTGKSWLVEQVNNEGDQVTFEISDTEPGVHKSFWIKKLAGEQVAVVRDQPARTEAEKAIVETFPEAQKIVEITDTEQAAADAATEDAPVELPAFAELTDLEQRSHVYLLHGVYSTDITDRATLAKIHTDLHAGKKQVAARLTPHTHG